MTSCLCTSEPFDDNGDSIDLRFSECSVEPLLPTRRTPEVTYLCAKHGTSVSYREAARAVADLTGLPRLSPTTVRKDTVDLPHHSPQGYCRLRRISRKRTIPDRLASWTTQARQSEPPQDRNRRNGAARELIVRSAQVRSRSRSSRARRQGISAICVCVAAPKLDSSSHCRSA